MNKHIVDRFLRAAVRELAKALTAAQRDESERGQAIRTIMVETISHIENLRLVLNQGG